jgi:hypothetical protein
MPSKGYGLRMVKSMVSGRQDTCGTTSTPSRWKASVAARRSGTCSGRSSRWKNAAHITGRPLARQISPRSSRVVFPPMVAWNRPRPDSPMARVRARNSALSASRLATGSPFSPTCASAVDDPSPMAPAAMASRTRSHMAPTSSAVAARCWLSFPITHWRMVEWPTRAATLRLGLQRSR